MLVRKWNESKGSETPNGVGQENEPVWCYAGHARLKKPVDAKLSANLLLDVGGTKERERERASDGSRDGRRGRLSWIFREALQPTLVSQQYRICAAGALRARAPFAREEDNPRSKGIQTVRPTGFSNASRCVRALEWYREARGPLCRVCQLSVFASLESRVCVCLSAPQLLI